MTNSPATNQGLWRFNTNAATYYPTTSGGVEDGFGSTNSRSLLAPLPDLTVPAIYGVAATTNLWRARLQGPVKQLLLTNTVLFSGTPLLGRSTQGAAQPFAGDIAELILFNRVLAFEEQKVVRDSLAQKYGITLELPHVPGGLSLVRTNVYESLLTWTAITGSENGLESIFAVERQSGTNSPFVPLQLLNRSATSYLDPDVLPEVNYFYRLSVLNNVGIVSSSALNAALPDADNDGLPDYLENQLGTNPNSTDSDGDGLPDAWEFKYGLNPHSSTGPDGAAGDFDNDGISNLTEYQQGTNPADGIVGDDPLIRLRMYRPN